MSVDMKLYRQYWRMIKDHGWPVYDHLPARGEAVTYPFVVIGEIDVTTDGDKTALSGKVNLTIDVWGKRADRKWVSRIAQGICLASIGTFRAGPYELTGPKSAQQVQILTDTSVPNTVYVRGMVSIELQIN